MVGDHGGAKELRELFVKLAMNSFTSIEYWEKKKLLILPAWIEAFNKEGAENSG